MPRARIASFYYPTKEEVADQFLRRVRIGAERNGHTVNVAVGSELWLRAQALGGLLAHVFANNKYAIQTYNPNTCTGDPLTDQASMFGIDGLPGSKAQGLVFARCSGTIIIPEGYRCTGPNGLKYDVTEDTTITTSGTVPVECVETGTAGNLDALSVLTWDSAALGYLQRSAVATGGINGGTEDESAEELRARWLLRLRRGRHGWVQVHDVALVAGSGVSRAFVYPACRGPGTIDVCIVGEENAVLSDVICDSVAEALQPDDDEASNCIGEHVDVSVTPHRPELVDVVVGLRLHARQWSDQTPWPTEPVRVTAVAGAVLTTDAAFADAPADGTHVAIIVDGAPTSYVVTSSADSGGFLELTLNEAPGAVTGAYLSADCEELASYAAAVETSFLLLGPGEKTDDANLLPRAQRRPGPDATSPNYAGPTLLTSLVNGFDEVEDASLEAVRATGTTTERRTPSLPAAPGDCPRLLTLEQLAFVAVAA